MKNIFIFIIISLFFLTSCNSVRESAGVNRKVIDEYAVIENPPLVIPPNFNLLPPEQIKSKDIEDTDTELAKEILFGLDDETSKENNEVSLIKEIIKETNANNAEDNIRDKINEEFAGQKSSLNDESIFESEEDLSKAIEQTNKKMTNMSDENSKKEKKKKRFFFF